MTHTPDAAPQHDTSRLSQKVRAAPFIVPPAIGIHNC